MPRHGHLLRYNQRYGRASGVTWREEAFKIPWADGVVKELWAIDLMKPIELDCLGFTGHSPC